MKIVTKRKIEKYEEVEYEFTQWDALELVSQFRYRKKNCDRLDTKWNGLYVYIEYVDGGVYMIVLSDDHDLYKRFDVTFTFEEI